MIPTDKQLTALELWAEQTAAALCPELDEMGRFRVMIGLLQARAFECRHIMGSIQLQTSAPTMIDDQQTQGSKKALLKLAYFLGDRSESLEQYGMEIAKRKTDLSSTGQGEGIQ